MSKNQNEKINFNKLNEIYSIEKDKFRKIKKNELNVKDIKAFIEMLSNNNVIDKSEMNNVSLIKRIISKYNNKYVSYQLVRYTIKKYFS